ncbi:enoyl-CoA hydratase/isomerase family protein, partial [Mesorhizobium sp. M4A.F.Ca.ET.020.02.1.1]
MSTSATVVCRREGPVAHVVLSRPEARNALNLEMCVELRRHFETLDGDKD